MNKLAASVTVLCIGLASLVAAPFVITGLVLVTLWQRWR